MKYLVIIFFFLPYFINAQEFPNKPANYVTDVANVLSEEEENKLNAKLRAFEDSTSNQLFVYVAASLIQNDLEN